MSDEIVLSINGLAVVAKQGERLIDVAKREGSYIPRFCYHPKLSVVASCRMCLVEIEGIEKAQPACSTLVQQGMAVKTQSKKAIDAQKAIMQFLLINHPLHCPICDQGGECELQDTAMGYGGGVSEFSETKRVVEDEDLGPLVATDMSLCIHCTRCVRFGKEIAGIADLGFVGRGDRAKISTYLNRGLKSELSGNMIDLCPVGALTSKPFQFKGRSWNFKQHRGISPHDCVGSHLNYHTIAKGYDHLSDVIRVLPSYHETLNANWLSDRDRFSYEGINAKERLRKPMMKVGDHWKEVGWEEALSAIMTQLKAMSPQHKKLMGVWLSQQMTVEEAYLAQHVFRQFGVGNIDHRILENTQVLDDMLRPSAVMPKDMSEYDAIVLVGSNIRYEQPMLAMQIKQACDIGKRVLSIGSIENEYGFPHECHLLSPQTFAQGLFKLIGGEIKALENGRVVFLLGEEAHVHVQAMEIKKMIHQRCHKTQHDYVLLSPGPNSLGLAATGCVPYQSAWAKAKQLGLNYQQMLNKAMQTMWLHQIDPMYDVSDPASAYRLLSAANVIAVTSYDTPGIRDCANIMLPLAVTAESPGSFINYLGEMQSFKAATCPKGDAKMGWSIYQVLASIMSLDAPADYDILHQEVNHQYRDMVWPDIPVSKLRKPAVLEAKWMRIGLSSWVRADAQVRYASSLQAAYPVEEKVWVNDASAQTALLPHIPQVAVSSRIASGALVYEKGQVFYCSSMGAVELDGGQS